MKLLRTLKLLLTGGARRPGHCPDALALVLNRRSCRDFSPAPLPPDHCDAILEAGRYAPSTVNLQTWSFITFDRQRWQAACDRPLPFHAPWAVVICADTYRIRSVLPDLQASPGLNSAFSLFNAGLAAMNMTIAAECLGYRSIMLSETGRTGLLDFGWLRSRLNLPDGVLPVTTLLVGTPSRQWPGIPPRQPADCVIMPGAYNVRAGTRLQEWLGQMRIGYKLTHPRSHFDHLLSLYRKKMAAVEPDIAAALSGTHASSTDE